MTTLMLKDELLDAQLLRAVGATGHGGADIGECVQALRGLDERDLSAWYEAWNELGERVLGLADEQLENGHPESARRAFLRACTYFRTAGSMLYDTPVDPGWFRATAARPPPSGKPQR